MILEIKDYFDSLRQRVIPAIEHFVCGCDEQSLRESISKFGSTYMFVDFGGFATTTDRDNRLNDSFEVGVTIATPLGSRSVTWQELLQIQQQCFDAIAAVRKAMLKDQREHPLMKKLSPTHNILPFVAPDIERSVGFTLTFQMTALDMLRAK